MINQSRPSPAGLGMRLWRLVPGWRLPLSRLLRGRPSKTPANLSCAFQLFGMGGSPSPAFGRPPLPDPGPLSAAILAVNPAPKRGGWKARHKPPENGQRFVENSPTNPKTCPPLKGKAISILSSLGFDGKPQAGKSQKRKPALV